ncbi:hypothetical protein [Brevundimonas sp.]|uniref:hypothetical protein n=1 Tax=Brevundimonas sp. TaxID=1871086 RepID=UPI003D6CD318
MTDLLIRIKASRQPYRRGGLELGTQWLEVETSSLTSEQKRALLQDDVLVIEGHNDDGSWSRLDGALRDGLLAVLAMESGQQTLDASGVPTSLTAAVLVNAQDLFVLGISIAEDRQHLVIPELVELITTERAQFAAAVEDFETRIEVLSQQLAAALAVPVNTVSEQTAIEGSGDPVAPPPETVAAPPADPASSSGEDGPAEGEAPPPAAAPKGGKSTKSRAD